jgi:hypothetical protein
MFSEINEQYLNRLIDDVSREQMKIMNEVKTETNVEKSKDNSKQLTILNQLLAIILRLRNMRKTIQQKINST